MTTMVVADATDVIPACVYDELEIPRPDEDTNRDALHQQVRRVIHDARLEIKYQWRRQAMAAWIAREYRTWEDQHESFDQWCRAELGYDRKNADKKIAAVKEWVGTDANLRRVSHMRALRPLRGNPEAVRRVIQRAEEEIGEGYTKTDLDRLVREELRWQNAPVVPPEELGITITGDGVETRVDPDTGEVLVMMSGEGGSGAEYAEPPEATAARHPEQPAQPMREVLIMLPADAFTPFAANVAKLKTVWEMKAVGRVVEEAIRRAAEAV